MAKQKETKAADNKKQSKPESTKGLITIDRLVMRTFLIASILLAIATAATHFMSTMRANDFRTQQTTITANGLAGQASAIINSYNGIMNALANDAGVVSAIASDSARTAKEQELSALFPSAARIKLLTTGPHEVDNTITPQLGYACIAMVEQAEKQKGIVSAEVHQLGNTHQHIDLVQRIMSSDGQTVAGTLLISLKVPEFKNVIGKTNLGSGYMELRQYTGNEFVALIKNGNNSLASSDPDAIVNVAGTTWKVAYWGEEMNWSLLSPEQTMVWGVILGSVLLLAMVSFAFKKTLNNTIRNDLVVIINLVKDIASGKLKSNYNVRLYGFRGAIENLIRMAPEFGVRNAAPKIQTHAPSVDEPSDNDIEEASLEPEEVAPDLIFQDKAGIQVEEVDESGAVAKVPASIFKAYDIRGIVGDTLTPAIAREIGRAIGSEAYERGQQSIIVARDGRLSGPKIIENLIKGLRETGRDVIDIGMVPTPVLYFATQYLNTGSGIMVTGSHNPPDYNGFKMVLRNETLSGEAIQGLRKRIEAGNFLSGDGGLESVDVVNDYLERITSDINLARPMKVILDCGNGVGGSVAPRLLQALGCELTELYCEVDGNFPNHHPDPSDPKNLLDLIKAVKEQGADVGLALDGDGDRLGVIDADGNVIWADRQMMLYAKDVLSRNAGAMIIYDIKCTNNLGTVIQQAGGTPLMWKTGHSFIKAKLAETGALLAGEMSGHIFFKERWFGFDDALYTAARLLEILAADKRTSTEIFASLPSAVSTPELKADTTEGGQFTFIEKFVAQASFEGAVLTTIDGLRADFEDGWGLVRASNTTPCLVIRFEAKTPQALKRIQEEFRKSMQAVDSSLSLPF